MDKTVTELMFEQYRNADLQQLLDLRLVDKNFRTVISHILRARAHNYGLDVSESSDAAVIKVLKQWETYRCSDYDTLLNLRSNPVFRTAVNRVLEGFNGDRDTLYKVTLKDPDFDKVVEIYYLPSRSILVACNILDRYYNNNGGVLAGIMLDVTQGDRLIDYSDRHMPMIWGDGDDPIDPTYIELDIGGGLVYVPPDIGDFCIIKNFLNKFNTIDFDN